MSEPSRGHVLVVDEHPQQRQLARSLLEQAGYRVSSTAPGEAALHAFNQSPSDLILLDVAQPDPARLEICQRLRELPSGDQVAIVLVTNAEGRSQQRQVLESGVDDCLSRPLSGDELLLRVQALLHIKQAQQQLRLERDALIRLQQQREETLALLVHDMKNPLAGVLSNAEFLTTSPGLDADQEECASDILHASRRVHRMVMSLLDVSQSDSGVLRPRAGVVDVAELIDQVRTQSGPKLRDKSLTLTVVLPAQPIPIEADRDMLLRLLGNLLENAMRHAPSFSSVRLEVIDDSDAVELRVSDVGAPIPPSDWAQLFDSHVQLEDNAARLRARRGLGLSSCRVIVEAHGGRIWLDESRRDGATFCVRLPRRALLGW